jgi:uncharacterized protein (TIGR03118 family)
MTRRTVHRGVLTFALIVAALFVTVPLQAAGGSNSYTVTPLVSDVPGAAPVVDPNLVNAWGLTASSTSPWWVADNGTSLSTLYNGAGTPQALVVTVGTDSGPTGVVFNGGAGFVVSNGTQSGPARFIFDGEDGILRGWNPTVDGTHALVAGMGDDGAIFKGLAIADNKLFAADFHNNEVAVFDSAWNIVDRFTDPGLPDGYAPFGIQTLGGNVFVTFAKQDADAEDEVAGQGRGFVDEFDTSGNLVRRVAKHGQLNAPWGLALAPSDFGRFGGDLLVGNFGDGNINAYELGANGQYQHRGELRENGRQIAIDGLWAIAFGNGANAGPRDTLFFTAGPDDESHGLFGKVKAN